MAAASSARETRTSAGSKVFDSSDGAKVMEAEAAAEEEMELEGRNGGFGDGSRQRLKRKTKKRVINMNAAMQATSA